MADENQKAEDAPEEAADAAAEEVPAKKAPPELTAEQKARQALKKQIQEARKAREAGRGDWDRKKLDQARRDIHRLRRKLRRTVKAAG